MIDCYFGAISIWQRSSEPRKKKVIRQGRSFERIRSLPAINVCHCLCLSGPMCDWLFQFMSENRFEIPIWNTHCRGLITLKKLLTIVTGFVIVLSTMSVPALEPTQPPNQLVPGFFTGGRSALSAKLTTHLGLMALYLHSSIHPHDMVLC